MSGFELTKQERATLLMIARKTIEQWLEHANLYHVNPLSCSDNLKLDCGAFVTLHKNKQLRGCIGRFITNDPLYVTIQQMALSAAFHDHRFLPVINNELPDIDIEISVLTPLQRIDSIDDFILGKHGIYIRRGVNSGTFLPQVAIETGWTVDEFLGHCARDKAGIGWDGWKLAELYVYEALVFGEKDCI